MPKITLDSLRESLDNEYGHTIVDLPDRSITLLNPNRLPKEKRAKVLGFESALSATGDDVDAQEALVRDFLMAVAENDYSGRALLDEVDRIPGDSLPILLMIFRQYLGDQGETSPSES